MEAGEGRSFEWSQDGELGYLTLSTPDNELNYFGPDTLERRADWNRLVGTKRLT